MSRRAVVSDPVPPGARRLSKVPFVELLDGKVHGCVSSGSDVERVYVAFVDKDGGFNCSTNNNRPCGGLRGAPCKHLHELVDEAIVQFGPAGVAGVLGMTGVGHTSAGSVFAGVLGRGGGHRAREGGEAFSRFLADLRYVGLASPGVPLPELEWFAP